ncbi:MAG TPA: AAA family ATPase [Candidatus Marinimicrobia bacterium]|nr:AAA family ATPase [Candidatus Neomarinimicrobiota bacterium]
MEKIEISIDQKPTLLVEKGLTIREILKKYARNIPYLEYQAIKNNVFASLNETVNENTTIGTFQKFYSSSRRAYENTAILILQYSIEKTLPHRKLFVLHSMGDGVYCELDNHKELSDSLLEKIKNGFAETVKEDISINPVLVSRGEAQSYLKNNARPDTAELIKYCSLNYVMLYAIKEKRFWAPCPPAPSTGLIKTYMIIKYKNGFVLRSPVENDPDHIQPFYKQERLYDIFSEAEHWGNILNLTNISQLNDLISNQNISEMIKISEALHEKKIAAIADSIDQSHEEKRLVFVAGPSSSGKTTFMKRLYIQLRVLGHKVISLSLDNYFKDRAEIKQEQGKNVNFEVLTAIDLKLLNAQLNDLLAGKKVIPPVYDFIQGKKVPGNTPITADKNTLFIIEGIHGINPELTQEIDDRYKFKIYISALTHLNFDDINRIPTHDTRLIRRIVRDSKFRGYSAAQTINMWKKVVEGEKKYIFKYQGEADIMFNSSLAYEMGVLKHPAELALKAVEGKDPSYPESERLLHFLAFFLPIDDKEVPPTSIIREFIGESSFKYD